MDLMPPRTVITIRNCIKLTKALGYEIGEPEDGFGFKYDWE